MPKMDTQTIMLAFIVVTGLAVLLQTIILLAIFFTLRRAARSVTKQAEELRSAVMPVVYNTRELLSRLTPKVERAVEDLAHVARGLRVQSAEMQDSVQEILDQLRQQTHRIDRMISSLLDGVDRAGGYVADVVSRPVRRVSAVFNSVKAIAESLRSTSARSRRSQPADGNDAFL